MKDFRVKPKKPVRPRGSATRTKLGVCPKCRGTLEEGKYHECAEAQALPFEP